MNSNVNLNQSLDFLSTPISADKGICYTIICIILILILFSFLIALCYRHLKKNPVKISKKEILLEDIKYENSSELYKLPQRKSTSITTNENLVSSDNLKKSLPSTNSESKSFSEIIRENINSGHYFASFMYGFF